MKVLSLFSGIGGLDLGLERAGMTITAQVEIDPFCREILAAHWPQARIYTDVTKLCRRIYDCETETDEGEVNCPRCGVDFGECECVGTDQFIDEHGLPDLVCGGFPCQDISRAGRGAGLEGERSGLWREFHRIVCELRPRYVVVENVSALLGRGHGRILGDLAGIGYDTEWFSLPAAACGAPHKRARMFILAYASCERLETVAAGRGVYDETRSQHWVIAGETYPCGGAWTVEPPICVLDHGLPRDVDALRALGNAVVPQVAEWIGRRIMAHSQKGGQQ
jgi:DNA (cytosine-5)-methyltransferase 1